MVEIGPTADERHTLNVYVVSPLPTAGHDAADEPPTIMLESYAGPVAARGLLLARVSFTPRQARAIGHVLARVARRAS